jgi:hypothetical protein
MILIHDKSGPDKERLEKIMFRYVGNKLTEIIPSKFQNLRLFLDDRDTISNKETFTRVPIDSSF